MDVWRHEIFSWLPDSVHVTKLPSYQVTKLPSCKSGLELADYTTR